MALKELRKSTSKATKRKQVPVVESKINKFIAKGGRLAAQDIEIQDGDHRLTLRIPKNIMNKIDVKRKGRVGKISRNLWILEILDKATKERQ